MHQRKIIALILIAYAGIFGSLLINDNENPIIYGLIVTILVALILSLILVTKSMNKEKKDKDDSES